MTITEQDIVKAVEKLRQVSRASKPVTYKEMKELAERGSKPLTLDSPKRL